VRSHLHLLSVLQLTWGAIMLMLGISTSLLAVGAAAVGWTSPGTEISAAVTALAFAIFAGALLVAGIANSWAGRALQRGTPRGRTVTLALAVPNLFVLPFGTALGIYALWVLLHNETRAFFES
jgi:F0F1-type ATP synthase membrane subunit c/vacuolar-type H+-ATPase subunit K